MPTRVLVTGAAGFLGSNVARSYLGAGAEVRGIVRSVAAAGLPPQVELLELDLQDLELNPEVFAGHDLVIHTAVVVHGTTPAERALQERVNVGVTRAVVAACCAYAVPRLLHVSSTAAVGISGRHDAPADETFPFNLHRYDVGYAETKREAEALVLAAGAPGFETVVVNPGYMFGRHRNGYRGSEVVARVLRRRIVPCTNGGLSVVHVDDVVDGIRRVAEGGRSGQRYILSGPNVSFHEIARTIAALAGERKLVMTVPDAVRDLVGTLANSRRALQSGRAPLFYLDSRYAYQYYSSEKAQRELGYEARSLESIVIDALAFMRQR